MLAVSESSFLSPLVVRKSLASLAPMGEVPSNRVNWETCHLRSKCDLCFWKEKGAAAGS